MIGFELKFRDKSLSLPFETSIVATRRGVAAIEEIAISAGAFDPLSSNHSIWLSSELVVGDEIQIEVKDVEHTTAPVEVFNHFDSLKMTKEESDKKTMERFLILKEELERENLL